MAGFTTRPMNAILEMKGKGKKVASIARTESLSRLTIYRMLEREGA